MTHKDEAARRATNTQLVLLCGFFAGLAVGIVGVAACWLVFRPKGAALAQFLAAGILGQAILLLVILAI